MKRMIVTCLSLLFLLSTGMEASAQKESGNENVVGLEREVPFFNAITIDGMLEVYLSQGDAQKVVVEIDENLQDNVRAVVKGETLSFEVEKLKKPTEFEIHITVTELKKLIVSGAAEVEGEGNIRSDDLKIHASGASEIELELDVKMLNLDLSGASDMELKGFANQVSAKTSGASDLSAAELSCKRASIKSGGASSVTIKVEDEVDGNSSGASELKILGDPKVKTITEEGAGTSSVFTSNGVKVKSTRYGDSTMVKVGDIDIEVIDGDTTRVRVGGSRIQVDDEGNVEFSRERKHRFDGHWGGFDLGVNYFLNADNEMSIPKEYEYLDPQGKSMNVHLNFFEQNFNLINHNLGLVTGLGLEYSNYRFENHILLVEGEEGIAVEPVEKEEKSNYKKSKLVVNHLNVPLLLEYQTDRFSKTSSFHVTVGVIGSLRIGSHTKSVWDDGGNEKNKVRDDFYLNPFKVESTVRIGWSKLNLYANYSMLPLFKDDKGPELYPFSIGLTLTSW